MLAQPFIAANTNEHQTEKIVIIDASASMLSTRDDETTRFDYAVSQVSAMADEFLSDGGVLTVIVAGQEASVVSSARIDETSLSDLSTELKSLECTYGEGDISGAFDLAEETLRLNPDAEVVLYTGTQYIDKGGVTVVDVSQDGEWNAAILNCSAELSENIYNFNVELACYGRDTYVTLYCDIYGVGEEKQTVNMSAYVKCSGDKTQLVEFNTNNEDSITRVSSYDYVYIHIDENDSFLYDNSFYLYGGERETIKIQYCSTKANAFFETVMLNLRNFFAPIYNIEIKLIQNGKAVLEGYDIYIFEHIMPEAVPQDGVVLLVNPNSVPEGVDIVLGDEVTGDFTLALGYQHPVIEDVYPERIAVTKYMRIMAHDGYTPLMYCGGDPVLLLKDDIDSKIGILSFSLNNSTLAINNAFPLMMFNLFNYFLPQTFVGNVFDVNDTLSLNSRGNVVSVSGPGVTDEFDEFPSTLSLPSPGIYTVSQMLISGNQKVENFYVKISSLQSNIKRSEDILTRLNIEREEKTVDEDLLLYFAAVLVTLLFVEWLLQSREQF